MSAEPDKLRLLRPIDPRRDHTRGGKARTRTVAVVLYGDFLCPYCRRLGEVMQRLRQALNERLAYTYRYFPNERAHPGAELMSQGAEAAGRQGRFWEMYDALFQREPPLNRSILLEIAAAIGLDMERFRRDLADPSLRERVAEDLADGRQNGVTATPTIYRRSVVVAAGRTGVSGRRVCGCGEDWCAVGVPAGGGSRGPGAHFQSRSGHGRQRPTPTDYLTRMSGRTAKDSGSLIPASLAAGRSCSWPP